MLRSAGRAVTGNTLRALKLSYRWNSSTSSVARTEEQPPAEPLNQKTQRVPKPQSTPLLSLFAVSGAVGSIALFVYLSGDHADEKKLKREMAERRATGVKRADPFLLSKTTSDFLRCIEPEAGPQYVSLGLELAVHGLTPEAEQHEKFSALSQLKGDNAIMSWADFGAFVVYHALKEMGAPLVFLVPKFGRGEAETMRRKKPPFPAADASLDEILEWGKQYNMDAAETLAVLGGQKAGSLLFTGAKERDITTSIYRRVVEASSEDELKDIPFGKALSASPFAQQCSHVFAQDHLYWNKYFVRGLEHLLEADWFALRPLPHRMSGTTTDAIWASRQQMIYGVSHQYAGSSFR
ncbi:hypothetical protein DIPPA_35656 [Diplonema papillatum]|nr:hypothetical protein DIPPA_35656 [Diplonema papillatum]